MVPRSGSGSRPVKVNSENVASPRYVVEVEDITDEEERQNLNTRESRSPSVNEADSSEDHDENKNVAVTPPLTRTVFSIGSTLELQNWYPQPPPPQMSNPYMMYPWGMGGMQQIHPSMYGMMPYYYGVQMMNMGLPMGMPSVQYLPQSTTIVHQHGMMVNETGAGPSAQPNGYWNGNPNYPNGYGMTYYGAMMPMQMAPQMNRPSQAHQ